MRTLLAGLVFGVAASLFAIGCASSGPADGGGGGAAKLEKCKVCGASAECKDGCCAKCAEKEKKKA
jgi:hypothetical protein